MSAFNATKEVVLRGLTCEAGVNIKVIQDVLGHADVSTTLGIYADVTKDLRKDEFAGLDAYFQKGKLAASNSEASVSQ